MHGQQNIYIKKKLVVCFCDWCVDCESEVFMIVGQWMLVPVWYKEFLVFGTLLIMKNLEDGGPGFIQTVGV